MSKIDLCDLERTSVEIIDNLLNKNPILENLEELADVQIPETKVNIPKQIPQVQQVASGPNVETLKQRPRVSFQQKPTESVQAASSTNIDMFSIGGFNLPKQTLFLIIILILIGIAMFYKTS